MGPTSAAPEAFTRAVAGLRAAAPREEILLEEIAAPQRLAPFGFALSATVLRDGDEVASGRLILLHDPAGHEAWRGDLRLVTLHSNALNAERQMYVYTPPGYTDALKFVDGNPYGVSLIAGHDNISEFDDATNNALEHLARRVVSVADRLT